MRNIKMKQAIRRRRSVQPPAQQSWHDLLGPVMTVVVFQGCQSTLPESFPARTVVSLLTSLLVVAWMTTKQTNDNDDASLGEVPMLRRPSRRSLSLGESCQSLLDLISQGIATGPSSSDGEGTSKFRSYPPQTCPQGFHLSTAPVEEDDSEDGDDEQEDSVSSYDGRTSPQCDDSAVSSEDSRVGLSYEDDDTTNVVSCKGTSTRTKPTMAKKRFTQSRNNKQQASRGQQNQTVPDVDASSQSSSEVEDSSTTQMNQSNNIVVVDEKKPAPKKDKTQKCEMNINPAAAFGVAGETLRRKLDSNRPLSVVSTKQERRRYLRSLYAHAGLAHNSGNDTVPLVPPLVLATNFNIRSSGAWSDEDYFYSRISNPTRHALEQTLAMAEEPLLNQASHHDASVTTKNESGATIDTKCKAACFGSGMAAVSAILGAAAGLMSQNECTTTTTALSSSSSTPKTLECHEKKQRLVHAVVPKTCYDEVIKTIQLGSGGIASFIRVDMTCLQSVEHALSKHPDRGKILYMETPDNPMTQVCDLEALVKIAHKHDAVAIVDTTWSPPLVGQVFRYGIDALCMSCTKTMGGHSDVLCGAVVANGATAKGRKLYPRVKDWQISHGGVASPFDCWLVLRGLRSFPVRMERMCASAWALAEFLESHDMVEWVRYPGLDSHPQHALATKQMDLFGQVFTFCVKGSSEAAMAFVGAVMLARRATSTGGTETLVQHQRSIEQFKVTDGGVIRVSVGLEDSDDIIDDFSRALDCSEQVCSKLGRPVQK